MTEDPKHTREIDAEDIEEDMVIMNSTGSHWLRITSITRDRAANSIEMWGREIHTDEPGRLGAIYGEKRIRAW